MKKKMLALVAVVLMGLFGIVSTNPALASGTCPPGSSNTNYTNSVAECNMDAQHKNDDLMSTVNVIINVVLGVLGVLTVAVIIIGAIQYVTSTGDMAKVTKAKNTIMYGVIGLVIALLAFAIVNFVLGSVFRSSSNSGGSEGVLVQTILK